MGREAAQVLLKKLEKIEKSDRKKGFNETEVEAATAYLERSGIKTGPSGITAKNLSALTGKLRAALKKMPADKLICTQQNEPAKTSCKVLKQDLKIEFGKAWNGETGIQVKTVPHTKKSLQTLLSIFGIKVYQDECTSANKFKVAGSQ